MNAPISSETALTGTRDDYQAFPLQAATIKKVSDVWGGESPQLVVNRHLLAGLRLLIRAHKAKPGGSVRYKHRYEDRWLGAALEELGLGTGGGRGHWSIAPRGREVLLAATAALGPLLAGEREPSARSSSRNPRAPSRARTRRDRRQSPPSPTARRGCDDVTCAAGVGHEPSWDLRTCTSHLCRSPRRRGRRTCGLRWHLTDSGGH